MGTQISEKDIRDIVAKVLSNMNGGEAATAKYSAMQLVSVLHVSVQVLPYLQALVQVLGKVTLPLMLWTL